MITRCPQCRAWFRVRAEHLKVANGYVTCGDCDAVFNALQTLVEESTPPPVLPDAVAPPPLPPAADTARASPAQGDQGDPVPEADAPTRIDTGITAPEDRGREQPDSSPVAAPPQARGAPVAPEGPYGQFESAAPGPAPAAGEARPGVPTADAGARARRADSAPEAAVPEPAAQGRTWNDGPPAITVQPVPARATPRAKPAPPSAASLSQDAPALDSDDGESASAAGRPGNAGPADITGPEHPGAATRPERAYAPAADGAEHANAASRPAAAPPAEGRAESPAEIEYDLFGAEFDDALAEPVVTAATPHGGTDTAAAAASPDEAPALVSGHALSADEHAILFTRPGADGEEDDEQEDDDYEDTVPEYDPSKAPAVLQSDIERLAAGSRRPTGRATRAVVAVLLAAAAAQLAWLQREELTRLVPAVSPAVNALCRAFPCSDGKGGPSDAIRLLARDVREHPQYREALLVNATLLNTGATSQPYPVIELSLHDAVGAVLGARRFEPGEYLDESIAIAEGMPPNRPVYVVMELGGDALSAISFEFTFL